MVGDQCPREAGSLGFRYVGIQSIQEVFSVCVIFEDSPAIDSSEDDMVHSTGGVYS
jgi:hypothetical protein